MGVSASLEFSQLVGESGSHPPSLEGYCDGSVLPMGLRDVKCLRHLVCLYIYFFFLAAGPSSDVHAPGLDS